MDEALRIQEYLPNSFKNEKENEYVRFLWDVFESNYQNSKYQFAVLACHMLYMSFVYFSIWQIKLSRPTDYQNAAIFLANRRLAEPDILGASSPFTFSKFEERTIFRFLRLIGCEQQRVRQFANLVDDRNDIAHPNGNIFFNDQATADRKITDILQQMAAIQTHMQPVIHDCFRCFLQESWDPEEREYPDAADQIREVLIHAHYFSQKDIDACLTFDINTLSDHEHFEAIKVLFDCFVTEYRCDDI